ncbi:MAG TPA: AbrB/MazE/SpoVT family DNA-binding domain-containing protein [Verrucomicrobiae bacterium]|jgi:bifunctional DNA-binding transcriptional regulator/antitoxin component of YhaV-PrlF toxin-antitoxin module
MTTTISLTSKRQCVLPKDFCERKGLKPNSPLRVTEIGEGLYITPVPEPTEGEFEQVVKLSGGTPTKRFAKKDEEMVLRTVKNVRAKRNHRS